MENTEKDLIKNEEVKPTWKRVVNISLNVLFYIFIAFLLIFAIANISSKKNNNIPSIFGYGFLNVATDSMDGNKEDSLKIGDLIIVKLSNEKRLEELEIEKSIVTYYDPLQEMLVTHRVVDLDSTGGVLVIYTQGDRVEVINPSADYKPGDDDMYLVESHLSSQVLAIYSGKISGAGKVLAFLQTKAGFGLCIVLPTALLLIFEAYLLIKNLFALNKEKLAAEFDAKGGNQNSNFDLEEEKRKIREELLAEMKREEEAKALKEKENKEE